MIESFVKRGFQIDMIQKWILERFANGLKTIMNDYDYILIDCPPGISLFAEAALIAADTILVPSIPDYVSRLGLALSIIVHELAHAFAGRWYGIRTSGIEVNCCGGLCHLEKAAPNPKADIVILLAGPASNLALWAVFSGLAYGIYELPDQFWRFEGLHWFGAVATTLASVNFAMFWFNLLPSHPLDGGRTMAAMMQGRLGRLRAMRIIAWSGMAVCGCLALASAGAGMFTLFIAYHLYMHNQQVLDTHRGPRLERWDK